MDGINADLLHFEFVRAALGVSASGLKNVCVTKSLRPPQLAHRRKRVPCNLKVLENRPSGLISFPLSFVSVAERPWRDAEIAL